MDLCGGPQMAEAVSVLVMRRGVLPARVYAGAFRASVT